MQKTISVVNLTAIRRNAQKIKSTVGRAKVFAVVKANAYGHGAEQVALCLQNEVYGFCVAIVEEGVKLRICGVQNTILVLCPPLCKYDCARAKFYNLTVTVNSVATAKLINGLPCHLKINTGMNRIGCNLSELEKILSVLNKNQIKGVYSHLYCAEDENACNEQLKIFNEAEKAVKFINKNALAHIAASGGILRGEKFFKDCVRCGILLYGYPPNGFKIKGFTPALKVFARRVQATNFIGSGVGYAKANKNYTMLSTYRLGYADGFFRTVPLGENNLCMDAFISQTNKSLLPVLNDAEKYATTANTISYEILCKATQRSEIIYEK
ncbi:MAG: alanine racemase [Clostridiales bacterium]|nr:alanine racemase [Clostridiales bacterium]